MRRWTRRRRIPFQAQMDASDCGAAALAMTLRYHGLGRRLAEVRARVRSVHGGVAARSIVDAARHFGLSARGVKAPPSALAALGPGTILFWRGSHFVVLERETRDGVVIADPAVGRRWVGREQVAEDYSGIAITFAVNEAARPPSAEVAGESATSRWPAARIFVPPDRRWGVVLGASLVLVAATVLTPLFVNHLSRASAGAFREELLTFVAIGAGSVTMYACAQVIRNVVLVELQGRSDLAATMTIMRRILGVPLTFTAARSSGDLMLRVRTSYVVREAVSGLAVSSVLDGVLLIGYLVVLMTIELTLSLLVFGMVCAQFAVLALVWRRQQLLNATAVDEQTRAQSHLFELFEGMATIKSMGLEATAVERFERCLRAEVSARVSARRNLGKATAVAAVVEYAAPLIVLGVGALLVSSGGTSLGIVLAFATIALGVFNPLASMVQSILQLSSLDAHLARVADVLDAPQEYAHGSAADVELVSGAIEFDDISFGYVDDAPVLRNVSLRIEPGAVVVIRGDSGAGKSTLAMVAAGLIHPDSGTVRFDGHDVRSVGPALRHGIGYVAQSSAFFSGTFRENIDLAGEHSDDEVRQAARLSGIDELIDRMPMRYRSTFTVANLPLSGGQRQRLALARALVREPPVLVLDEATNALDTAAERDVIERITALGRTLLVVSHRPYSHLHGDMYLTVCNGTVVVEGGDRAPLATAATMTTGRAPVAGSRG